MSDVDYKEWFERCKGDRNRLYARNAALLAALDRICADLVIPPHLEEIIKSARANTGVEAWLYSKSRIEGLEAELRVAQRVNAERLKMLPENVRDDVHDLLLDAMVSQNPKYGWMNKICYDILDALDKKHDWGGY